MSQGAGTVVLVTGAGSGMGRLAALRHAASGASVAALDVDERGLSSLAGVGGIERHVCDVTDAAAVESAVRHTTEVLGPVRRVVHAAGICRPGLLAEQPVEEIRRVLEVNVLGTVHVVHAVLPGMLERGAGELVLFASLAGWLPTARLGAYDASKHAVVAYAEVLFHELDGSGVRVVCVCPPVVETPMVDDMRRRDPRSLGGQRGIAPGEVLDALDRALAATGRPASPFVFPGRGTRTLWRLRRLAPGLLWRISERAQR
jgi:NAD(P)-dependent dehydrogenase (short-subunit alcohol dehydrogenase family)